LIIDVRTKSRGSACIHARAGGDSKEPVQLALCGLDTSALGFLARWPFPRLGPGWLRRARRRTDGQSQARFEANMRGIPLLNFIAIIKKQKKKYREFEETKKMREIKLQ
jgi:hypothetical protein